MSLVSKKEVLQNGWRVPSRVCDVTFGRWSAHWHQSGGIQIVPRGSVPFAVGVRHDGSIVHSWYRHWLVRHMAPRRTESGIFGCIWVIFFGGGFLTVFFSPLCLLCHCSDWSYLRWLLDWTYCMYLNWTLIIGLSLNIWAESSRFYALVNHCFVFPLSPSGR